MTHSILRAWATSAFATAALLAAAHGDATAASTQRVPVIDSGFGAPVTAFTVELPADWSTRGGVRWNRSTNCVANQMRLEWAAGSTDGRQAVEVLPGFSWQIRGWNIEMNPCPVAAIDSVRGYLEAVGRELYAGAQVVGYRDRPDVVAESNAGAQPQLPPNMRQLKQAGELTLTYPGRSGPVREILTALATFTEVTVQGVRPSRMGQVSGVFVTRSADGKDIGALGERVRKSFKVDPAWSEQLQTYGRETVARLSSQQRAQIDRWHNQRMAEISARGAADRAAIRAQTVRDIGEINAAGWKSRQQSMDRMHRDNVDTIREVNRYQDPTTNRQVELSSHYNHGFRTNDGRYVATDNPNFNPGAGGQEMKRVR